MRPTRQTVIIQCHIKGFENLSKHLGTLLDKILHIIKTGESWIQGSNELGTFSQANCFLDNEMECVLKRLHNIAEEKGDIIQTGEYLDPIIQEKKTSVFTNSDTNNVTENHDCDKDVQSNNDLLDDLSTQIISVDFHKGEEFKHSLDRMLNQMTVLQEKIDDQATNFDIMKNMFSKNDICNNEKFREIFLNLQAASDFIQTQTDLLSEKLKQSEQTYHTEINEKLKYLENEYKDFKENTFIKYEEYDTLLGANLNEIKAQLQTHFTVFGELGKENKYLSSKIKRMEKNFKTITLKDDTNYKTIREIESALSKNNLILKDLNAVRQTLQEKFVYLDGKISQLYESSSIVTFQNSKICKGAHETLVSIPGEEDLHKQFLSCQKNPDHAKFIPVKSLSVEHLPVKYRDKELFQLIKATATLTVRVDVKMTSTHRPKFWPKTYFKYPFHLMTNNTILRTGTGMVGSEVIKFTKGYDQYGDKHLNSYSNCWCKRCQHSKRASHVWWEFHLSTASQVVFDDIEASHTTLRFFYVTEESPVVKVDQVKVVNVNIERDSCRLKFVTCDEKLANKLICSLKYYFHFWKKVYDKNCKSRDVDKLTFIVSHPHGIRKHVSFGQWVDKNDFKYNLNQFTYNTCTCPGCSGARVHCVGYGGYALVHSGSINTEMGYSGAAEVF